MEFLSTSSRTYWAAKYVTFASSAWRRPWVMETVPLLVISTIAAATCEYSAGSSVSTDDRVCRDNSPTNSSGNSGFVGASDVCSSSCCCC